MKNADIVAELIETLRQEHPDYNEANLQYEANAIIRHACCTKARLDHCVCMYKFVCPEHGEQHIGTHN